MNPDDGPGLPPGRQPYDPLSGMRVGAVAGGIVGVLILVLVDGTSFWWVLVAAVIGGAVGYLYERRRLRPPGEDDA